MTHVPAETGCPVTKKLLVNVIYDAIVVYVFKFEVTRKLSIAICLFFFSYLPDSNYAGLPDYIYGLANKPVVSISIRFFLTFYISFIIQHIFHVALEVYNLISVKGKIHINRPAKIFPLNNP